MEPTLNVWIYDYSGFIRFLLAGVIGYPEAYGVAAYRIGFDYYALHAIVDPAAALAQVKLKFGDRALWIEAPASIESCDNKERS